MVVELDTVADALLTVWEAARERTTSRVSGAQLRAIMLVEQHEGINLRGLATGLDMLLSSASRLCDRLVAAGMLEREPGRFDRREISLHLTAESRRLLAELRDDRRQQLAAILADMTDEGRQALLRGMREFDEAARHRNASVQSVEAADPWPAVSRERPVGLPTQERPGDGPRVARSA
ncbi:MarR family transcriptional regulator [Micromonospora sp. NPDC047812]|uniref:MarR family winged helix-turn-helix transcriptional regulator n=1 Tax=Micromonospora sp. NPDC047812 TaxID=3155742 RepID=UPI0034566664